MVKKKSASIIGMSGIQDFLFVPRSWHADYKIQHILSFVSRCSRQLGSLWVKAILRKESNVRQPKVTPFPL